MQEFGTPKFRSLGVDAFVLDLSPPHTLEKQERIWHLHALSRAWNGVNERVAGLNNLTLRFDPASVDEATLRAKMLEALRDATPAAEARARTIEIPVRYGGDGGPDLSGLAEATGLSEREIVERHCAVSYRVYFLGFQPGFAYLGDVDPLLRIGRRATPRPRVPAGSVAIAGAQTAVYPFESPGGWNIIGATALPLFDARREPPALLAPGDAVRFVKVP